MRSLVWSLLVWGMMSLAIPPAALACLLTPPDPVVIATTEAPRDGHGGGIGSGGDTGCVVPAR